MAELGGSDERAVADADLVMHGVALLEAAQDGDGVLHARLADQHLLEAAFECGVLLQVLAVLVERGRTDAAQLAARERGLEHVAGIHGAIGLAGTDQGVDLVDEQDHLAIGLREVVEHRLQALLELAAELGARDERREVEREQALVLEGLRHLAVDDALCQALDDGGLAHARLADQHRIVLGAAREDLDGAADFLVAADHRVELAAAGTGGEIVGVFLERLAVLLGIGRIDLGTAAHGGDGLFEQLLAATRGLQRLAECALVVERGEEEQLAGDEGVATRLRGLVGEVEQAVEIGRDGDVAIGLADAREALERRAQLALEQIRLDAGLFEQGRAAVLIEQCKREMHGFDGAVIAPDREALGLGERLLEATG